MRAARTSRDRSELLRRPRLPTPALRHQRRHPLWTDTRARSSGHLRRSRGCRAASGTSLVCRCHAPRDAMPRLRARRPSPPSPRLRTSRRIRARGRWRPGIPRARRQRYRRRRRRGLRACRCLPSGCPRSSRQAGRYQPSCAGTRRGSDLARRAPPATARAAAPQASAARGAIQALGCQVRQPLCIRGFVRPTGLVASAAADKRDGHQGRSNPAPLRFRHEMTFS